MRLTYRLVCWPLILVTGLAQAPLPPGPPRPRPTRPNPSQVIVTITGRVDTASDYYGNVFTNSGTVTTFGPFDTFSLVFTFNDDQASESVATCSGEVPYYSQGTGTDSSATAVLTINGHRFTFGGNGNGRYSGSWRVAQFAAIPCSTYPNGAVGYYIDGDYGTSGYHGGSNIGYNTGVDVQPASGHSFSSSFDWRTSLFSVSTNTSSSSIPFNILYSSGNSIYDAYGYLTPTRISINGTACDIPLSEATKFDKWGPSYGPDPFDPTIAGYLQTLQDINGSMSSFSGGYIREQDAGGGSDGCYTAAINAGYSVSAIPFSPGNGVSGGPPVAVSPTNRWADVVGYSSFSYGSTPPGATTLMVEWYQAHIPTRLPCNFTWHQRMQYQCPSGGSFYDYGSTDTGYYNTLQGFINSTAPIDTTSWRSGVQSGPH